jgi:hypothetical protein
VKEKRVKEGCYTAYEALFQQISEQQNGGQMALPQTSHFRRISLGQALQEVMAG